VTFYYQVDIPGGQLKISAGQNIGIYFPADAWMALRFKEVNPKYSLYGSPFIPGGGILSLGKYLNFYHIGYLNKLAIEFYLRSGNYFINLNDSLIKQLIEIQ